MKVTLPEPAPLLEVLRRLVPGASNRTLRKMLELGRVRVQGEECKRANRRLRAGEVVELTAARRELELPAGLRIVHEDEDLLVVLKPSGLLTVATPHEKERTAFAYLRAYLRAANPPRRLFIVHRLDKFASGLLVFAKSEQVKAKLQEQFRKHDIQRKYWAIVEGYLERDSGTIRSRLVEDARKKMRTALSPNIGKPAVTHFRVVKRFSNLTSLEITLETGRKNQIRVHLSESGHPIVGDRSYGCSIDPVGRLGLHAFLLAFRHPTTGALVAFESDPPEEFRRYLPVETLG